MREFGWVLVAAGGLEQARVVGFETAHCVVVEHQAFDAAIFGEGSGLRLDFLGGEHSANGGEVRVAVEQVEVAGELFDSVDFASTLDLDGHGLTGGVFAQNVDRADGREVFAANQGCAFFENLQLVGEQFLQVRLDAVFCSPGSSPRW